MVDILEDNAADIFIVAPAEIRIGIIIGEVARFDKPAIAITGDESGFEAADTEISDRDIAAADSEDAGTLKGRDDAGGAGAGNSSAITVNRDRAGGNNNRGSHHRIFFESKIGRDNQECIYDEDTMHSSPYGETEESKNAGKQSGRFGGTGSIQAEGGGIPGIAVAIDIFDNNANPGAV